MSTSAGQIRSAKPDAMHHGVVTPHPEFREFAEWTGTCGTAILSVRMARPRTNPKGPKRALPVRIDVDLYAWLEAVCQREGWTLTESVEWALSGVRYLEVKLGSRLLELLEEQRSGGDDVFTTLWRRLDEALQREGLPELKVIVPPGHKRRAKPKP